MPLEVHPEGIDTRAIALRLIEAKALDVSDRHLRKAIAYKIVQVLWRLEKRVEGVRSGMQGTAIVRPRAAG